MKLHAGTVRLPSGISLSIIDCKSWHVNAGKPACRRDLDVSACETCVSRESREGNLHDPPLFGKAAKKEPMRGLGDVVAAATKAVGIKPCAGCERRRIKLNKFVPFGKKEDNGSDQTQG